MIELRELSMENFEEIRSMFLEVFTAEPWNDDWSDDRQLREYLLDLMTVRTPLQLGLYKDGELIGISLGNIRHWWGGTEYYIEEICIRTSEQGRGLGTKFFELIAELIPSKGAAQIYLTTEKHVPAYEFYKKLGFQELDDHTAFFKELESE